LLVDAIDRKILQLLTENARSPLSDLAAQVGLSAAPVRRRIDRLEEAGVIERYTVVINYARAESMLEAFMEVRIPGTGDIDKVYSDLKTMPEILQLFTTAGDPDVLIRLRVDSTDHLEEVVKRIRRTGQVLGTKTLIVLDEWTR
jgi:DNA-binding Lrp family transcriptional regulator